MRPTIQPPRETYPQQEILERRHDLKFNKRRRVDSHPSAARAVKLVRRGRPQKRKRDQPDSDTPTSAELTDRLLTLIDEAWLAPPQPYSWPPDWPTASPPDWLEESGLTPQEYFDRAGEKVGSSLYGQARQDLIGALDQVCSYCGVKVYSHLDVEHELAKSRFPDQTLVFSNFLIACSACNTSKGNSPNQETRKTNTAQARDFITNVDNYAWPQLYGPAQHPAKSPTPRFPFSFRMQTAVPRAEFLTVAGDVLDALTLEYKSGVVALRLGVLRRTPQPLTNPGTFALVVYKAEGPPGFTSPEGKAPFERMIDVAGLDVERRFTNRDGSDYRLSLFAITFFKARDLLDRLHEAATLGDVTLSGDLATLGNREIQSTGFFSVWLTTLAASGQVAEAEAWQSFLLDRAFAGTSPLRWRIP